MKLEPISKPFLTVIPGLPARRIGGTRNLPALPASFAESKRAGRSNLKFSSGAGFSLIELLTAIMVIGVIMGGMIAILDPVEQINKARDTTMRNNFLALKEALDKYYSDNDAYPAVLSSLGSAYIKEIPPATGYTYLTGSANQWVVFLARKKSASTDLKCDLDCLSPAQQRNCICAYSGNVVCAPVVSSALPALC